MYIDLCTCQRCACMHACSCMCVFRCVCVYAQALACYMQTCFMLMLCKLNAYVFRYMYAGIYEGRAHAGRRRPRLHQGAPHTCMHVHTHTKSAF